MQNAIQNSIRFPHLLKCKLLTGLPETLKRKFLNSSVVKTFDAPVNFIHQGNAAKGIFLIAHGSVEISRLNTSGQNAFMSTAEVGNCVGEIEAVAEKESIASVTASKGTILLFLPNSALPEYLGQVEFVRNLSLIFLERMENNNSFRSVDRLDPVDIRLRSYLHFMSRQNSRIDKGQTDLAEIICCSRQTLNKELGKLRRLRILDINSGSVVILDRERLADGIDLT